MVDITKNSAPTTVDEVDLGIQEEMLSFLIRSVNIALTRDIDEKLGELDVAKGTGKASTLLLVGRHPGIRPSIIAQMILKDRSAMGRLIDQLEGHGLLRRDISAEDNRVQELYLTPAGEELAAQIREHAGPQSEGFFSILTAKEKRALIDALRKIYRREVGFKS